MRPRNPPIRRRASSGALRGPRAPAPVAVPAFLLRSARETPDPPMAERRAQVRDGLEQAAPDRTAELRSTVRELEAFSYTILHDLQAPLRAMRGFARILREDHAAELSAPARRLLDRIEQAGVALGNLVDGTLALAQVSKCELRRRPVDLSVLAQRAWQQLVELEPGCRATIEIAPGLRCTGDETLLGNALANLLGNARKFSRGNPAAHVEFGARRERGETVFFVRDNGAGFDMQYAGKLFQPFQRLHPEREFEGSGIGLASVRNIVERHGGRIWPEHSAPGAGATFCFTLDARR